MDRFRRYVALSFLLLMAQVAGAQNLPLQNLDETEFKNVVSDLSANFLHTSVSGAAPLGDIFGFEVGLIGGLTNSSEIDKLVKAVDADAKADRLPHAALIGVLTVPLALTFEGAFVPKVGSDDFSYSTLGLAVKWTPSELFFDLPVDIAIKAHTTQTNLTFQESISGTGATKFEYDNGMLGATLVVSRNFGILEPYIGYGQVQSKGELNATGPDAGNVFIPSYTASTSVSEKVSSGMWMVGTEVKLVIVRLGVEYTNVFDTSRFTGKLSFYF